MIVRIFKMVAILLFQRLKELAWNDIVHNCF